MAQKKKRAKSAAAKPAAAVPPKDIREAAIQATFERLKEAKDNRKIEYARVPHKIVYWSSLILLLICNLIVSITLIPFILMLSDFKFYILVVLLAFVFGFLFNLIINDIEHIETKHHIFAIIFLPLVAIINIILMIGMSNKLGEILKLSSNHDPLMPALLYAIVFILPYVFSMVKKEAKMHR